MPLIRLQTLFPDILFKIFTHLSLIILEKIIGVLPSNVQNVTYLKLRCLPKCSTAHHTFTFSYFEDFFSIPAIILFDATRTQTSGPIMTHYKCTKASGSVNPSPRHFRHWPSHTSTGTQWTPRMWYMFYDPVGLTFQSQALNYSSRGQYNVYKYILERPMEAGQWAEYFSEWIEVYVKVRLFKRNMKWRMSTSNLKIFFICKRLLMITKDRIIWW